MNGMAFDITGNILFIEPIVKINYKENIETPHP